MMGMSVAAKNEIYEEGTVQENNKIGDSFNMEADNAEDKTDDTEPVCRAHPDCHAWKNGRCIALTDTDFGTRGCPFYKNRDQNEWEQQDALERLIDKGRMDLIEKYKVPLLKLGVLPDEEEINSSSGSLEDPYIDQIAAELDQYSEQCMDELLEKRDASGVVNTTEEYSEEGWDD